MASSSLGGVIAALRDGHRLPDEQIDEIEAMLDALHDAGWSGFTTAGEAVLLLTEKNDG